MPERIRVTPIEASVILVNEMLGGSFSGQYSQEVAKALHGSRWKEYYHLEDNPFTPKEFLQDAQRSQLLVDSIAEVLATVKDRERRAVRMRFGFEDGLLHTLKEIGVEFGLTSGERPRQIIAKSLRKLRHPSRLRPIKQLLPERP